MAALRGVQAPPLLRLDRPGRPDRYTRRGWIGNANLIDETTPQDILRGYEFMRQVSADSGLPLMFITAADRLLPQIAQERFGCPLLTITRQLVPPWENAAAIS